MEFNATFIVAGISFIIFTFIMNAIFYKPIEQIVEKRKKFIADTTEEAKLNREKSDAILKDRDEKISSQHSEAKKLISDISEKSKLEKNDLAKSAQSKAANEINSAKELLGKEQADAQGVLTDDVINLAQNISSKLLGENVSVQNPDKAFIENILKEGE